MFEDPFESLKSFPGVKTTKFATPGGKTGKPFQILRIDEDSVTLRTSTGGRVSLRSEVFQVALQILRDLGEAEEEGWVLLKDDVLNAVLRGQNRDKACTSYVFPLLQALGKVEIKRGRPVKLRLSEEGRSENS